MSLMLYTLVCGDVINTAIDLFVPDYKCDILVVGAGCAGVYAAYSARREGADVILVENDENIGGMHVQGNVHGYYYGAKGGTFEEDDVICRNNDVYIGKGTFPFLKQALYTKRLAESGIKMLCGHTPTGIIFDGDTAVGLRVFDGEKKVYIGFGMIIDATSDGHIIRMTNVPKKYGREIDGKTVPFTVRTQYMKDGKYIAVNTDSGFVNQYDCAEFSKKTIIAHSNASRYIHSGEFIGVASHTGVREGLTYEGEEKLKYEDIILDNPPEKVLFYAYSDLDKHGHDTALDDELYQTWWVISNLATVTARIPVPMGAVVPKGLKGIVTAGRCFSCDSYAQSAVRMNRDMFRMGECVGIAAAIAVKSECGFTDIDYDKYIETVRKYGCYDGDITKKFGFDYPGGNEPYKAVVFGYENDKHLLKTETPGVAIWSCFINKDDSNMREELYNTAVNSEDNLTKYNHAIALGVTGDERALPLLRKCIEERDCFWFKDCRRSNQFRSVIAVCLLGRLGDLSDASLLEEIIFNDSEFDKEMYHTLKPDYLYYKDPDRNFVYFQMFTHACMSLVKIYKRSSGNIEELKKCFEILFSDDKIIHRVTHEDEHSPAYIEISDFIKYILKYCDMKGKEL